VKLHDASPNATVRTVEITGTSSQVACAKTMLHQNITEAREALRAANDGAAAAGATTRETASR
jgi:hypothetical protein